MSKKLRKRRAKRRARSNPSLSATKEVSQQTQPLPASSKQAPVAKSPTAMAEQAERYRYVVSDLKRTAILAGAIFLVLIVLYFFLR